jgi:hypothetical protein
MVARDGEKPGLSKQFQAIQDTGASVNHIADTDSPINAAIKADSRKCAVKIGGLEVDIANDVILSVLISSKS